MHGTCTVADEVVFPCNRHFLLVSTHYDRNYCLLDVALKALVEYQSIMIMALHCRQITSLMVVYSAVIRAQIKENIKAPRHWPLCGEVTGTGEFPAQMVSNAENVSIWWRHHGKTFCSYLSQFPDCKESQYLTC